MCLGIRAHEDIIERAPQEQAIFWRLFARFEQRVAEHPNDYLLWFNFVSHVQEYGDHELVRRTFEQATANAPLSNDKRSWRPYIDLWILYAHYEEHKAQDIERARQVYKTILDLIPHATFTFSKMWLLYAWFLQRHDDMAATRVVLIRALDMCPRAKLFQEFIAMEIKEGEIEACRRLYRDFLEYQPENSDIWIDFAQMEIKLGEIDRARDIFNQAVNEIDLDDVDTVREAHESFLHKHYPSDSMDVSR